MAEASFKSSQRTMALYPQHAPKSPTLAPVEDLIALRIPPICLF